MGQLLIKLFPHQQEALDKSSGYKRVGYFHDMGLGKTFTGSEKMQQVGARINLIVCQKSKIGDWLDHIKEHYNYLTCDLTKKNELEKFLRAEDTPICGVINYDLLFRRGGLSQLKDFTLMLDESSMIQNDKAKRSKFILKMKAENVILLSGTPTSGKYENLWTQCRLLGWNISKTNYNNTYVNWRKIYIGGFPIKTVNKRNPYKNVERLKRKLRENGADFLKTEDCFELPMQTFIPVVVNSSKEYLQFAKDAVVKVGDIQLVGDTTLTKRMYMRQLCGQYSKDKLDAFKDLVDSTNDRLIVFYNFTEEYERLKKLVERPISVINGQKKDLVAYETEDDSVTFIQYQAGSMGLNLQKVNKIVYFTLTERSELFEQSKKRTHRIGQDKPCFYYIMLCEGSIEENINTALEQYKDYTDFLFKEEFA